MNKLSVKIKTSADLVNARLALRNFLLHDLNCSPFTVVRPIVAITAMGEFIIGTKQKEAVNIECSLVEDSTTTYLQFTCELFSEYDDNSSTRKALFNFNRMMDETAESPSANIVSGLQILKRT